MLSTNALGGLTADVISAISSFREGQRLSLIHILFACLFPFYLLLCGATVYIQAHYLIDSIVGFVSAFGIYILATWMFKRWFAQPMCR